MAYYNECPYCGAYLDPGEECECVYKRKQAVKRQAEASRLADREGMWEQLELAI